MTSPFRSIFGVFRTHLFYARILNMTKTPKRPLANADTHQQQTLLQFFSRVEEPKTIETPTTSTMTDEPPQKKTLVEANAEVGTFKDRAIAGLRDPKWVKHLQTELSREYMIKVFEQLDDELKRKAIVYPPIDLIFNAFNLTPFDEVRVVIIGQDPYHGPNQAQGLSFSVPKGVPKPPSLQNIFKELAKEYPQFRTPDHGSLVSWAKQGVFLLNASLTVRKNEANSHRAFGWQEFTDSVIKLISQKRSGVVFLLWGQFAQKKESLIDHKKHAVVKTAHPSPLSYRYFMDCRCFSKVNEELKRLGKGPIDWTNL